MSPKVTVEKTYIGVIGLYQTCSQDRQCQDQDQDRKWQYETQEAQLMLTTGSTRLAVSRGQQTWYHSTCYI